MSTIPHNGCKTPSDCRKEQICLDSWHCSSVAKPEPFVLLICGFGRCGSSLVMQMLDAGGYPATGQRPAYEDDIAQPTKRRGDPKEWQPYIGRAVKLLDPQRGPLPRDIPFRAIWLDRDHKEQAKSQAKFAMWSMGLHIDRDARRAFERSYRADRPKALAALARIGAAPASFLTFERLLSAPLELADAIQQVVGVDLDLERMAETVIPRGSACYPGMLEERLLAREFA